jgi:AraC family transcriptional regulator
MEARPVMRLEQPRFETHRAFFVGGLQGRFSDPPKLVPELWQRFVPHLGKIPGQVGCVAYGVASFISPQGACDYTAGVEVVDFSSLPEEFAQLKIPANKYAVFGYGEHVSKLGDFIDLILSKWLPASRLELREANAGTPAFFERYGEKFDPIAGKGDVEVWVPVRA